MPKVVRPNQPLSAKEFTDIVRSKSIDAHVRLRAYAVFLASQGLSAREVADIVGSSVKSVRHWIKLWNEQGLKGLESKKGAVENQL